jgi:hypothetical protein
MDAIERLRQDMRHYGVGFLKHHPDGTVEVLDPDNLTSATRSPAPDASPRTPQLPAREP